MKSFAFELNSQKNMRKRYQKLHSIINLSESLTGFKKNLERFVDFLTRQLEVKVWHSLDRSGHILWHVYDPYTERTYNFASEQEVRAWLDCYR